MKPLSFALALALLAAPTPVVASETDDWVGRYRVSEGPEVAGGLLISADGSFQYGLTVGSLDERAEGRWEHSGDAICLFTEPTPVAPAFSKVEPPKTDTASPTLRVTSPKGRGISGVDFRIGFDSGDPIEGYTQQDGWSMPVDDLRIPRWIELSGPIDAVIASRFELTPADDGKLVAILQPNDFGVVNFNRACLEKTDDGAKLHRSDGTLRLVRLSD